MKKIHSVLISVFTVTTILSGCAASDNSANKTAALPTAYADIETAVPTNAPTETIIPAISTSTPEVKSIDFSYVGNKSTKKFHRPNCKNVYQMKDSNKVSLHSRDKAINGGYVPCKNCNP